jgi:4-hydroxybenzoate polyprenyltransferase
MKLMIAFLKLIRWPNLVFIALTQYLFYYCIVLTAYQTYSTIPTLTYPFFACLLASSLFIAAAGYIINDYFDLNIDHINKPQAVIIEKFIKRRWAILWHIGLSSIGILLAFYVGYVTGNWWLGIANFICVVLLWFYSTAFKKRNLTGNIIIALLTAWVILVLYLAELRFANRQDAIYQEVIKKIFKQGVLYAGFAFIVSLVREVVKDMEDIAGDRKYGGRTLPIVWGVPAAKIFAAVWLSVMILGVLIVAAYGVILGRYLAVAYALLMIVLPAVAILKKLNKAVAVNNFSVISQYIKWTMLTGILSIVFFKWHL